MKNKAITIELPMRNWEAVVWALEQLAENETDTNEQTRYTYASALIDDATHIALLPLLRLLSLLRLLFTMLLLRCCYL